MGIMGRYVEKFSEANIASMVDVSMNGDYDFHYDIQKIEKGRITVRSHKDGKVSEHVVIKDRQGYECFHVMHSGTYQKVFGGKPEKIKVMPFQGEKT